MWQNVTERSRNINLNITKKIVYVKSFSPFGNMRYVKKNVGKNANDNNK